MFFYDEGAATLDIVCLCVSVMVLPQLLLPATASAGTNAMTPLTETRRELTDKFSGHRVSPFAGQGPVDGARWRYRSQRLGWSKS